MKTALFLLVSFISLNSFAIDYRIQKVKVLGPMKHKVIFQSKDLKKVKRSNVLKGKLVAQWGTQVFEVVQGLYTCDANKLCKLSDYERLATFQSCVAKNSKKLECKKRLDGRSSSNWDATSNVVVINDNPDAVEDEFSGDNRRYESEDEFPARAEGEFDDLF
jgi:hypothetical protein